MKNKMIKFKNISPNVAKSAFIADGAKVIGDVSIGEDSSVWFNCVLRGDVNYIKIGKRTNVQDLTTIHVWHASYSEDGELLDAGYPTIIGDDVTIGHNCVIHACKIDDRCLVGMNAVVMDGAKIGCESIVGAGSVITKGKVFPPRSLILGSPAKLVRQLNDEEAKSLLESAQNYVKFKDEFLKNCE
ncbi:gamma carbonic anhydrase family protein [Campylobacter geochelonis]|uniref:Carbonic anhydrase, family 3 n=2 Tax=Campylobacter geochelonis TaxID=1780362 RepID=A0A128EI22_9BACT|nr:gamma carbonic anhydrase family protein [Campylobacter geochelonis]CZE47317.1 carbonic anhydrase%2C family 3 [Campylobacter geochelonis]CZE48639.1 carbonic anhydrase%2C family 3 [Campylobacter geochelonis]CZE50544.1 carbonic anhydrase%2C family 3 [Campylobacter geochelonis]